MDEVKLVRRQPSVEEFMAIRGREGWAVPDKAAVEESIRRGLFAVVVEKDGKAIGMGRVAGDGGVLFVVQDLIVDKGHRKKGYGRMMMDEIMAYIGANAPKGAFIGLFAKSGLEGWYARYGFSARPAGVKGAGMSFIKN